MSILPSAPHDAAASCANDVPDPYILRAEHRLRLLEELAEIGMDLARSLRPAPAARAAQTDASEAPQTEAVRGRGRDPADAFGPLSRAIRLTLALGAKTDAELRDLKAGIVRTRVEEQTKGAERVRLAAEKARENRIDQVRELVVNLADEQIADKEVFEDVEEELELRLSEHEAEFGSPERPLRETVEGLCKAMGLSPDWSCWNGHGWALDDSPFRPFVYAPRPSRAGLAEAASPPSPALTPPPPRVENAVAPEANPTRSPQPIPMPPWRLELARERGELAHDLE